MNPSISRRNLIAATAVAATAVGTNAALADEIGEAFDEEFDIIVVGAGIAGTAAAITCALEGNGATCLLLEKGDTPGGCSPFCGGGAICTEDPEALAVYLKDLSGDFGPGDEFIAAYARGFAENWPWLQSFVPAELLDLKVPMADGSIEYQEFGTGQGVINHMHMLDPETGTNNYTHRMFLAKLDELANVVDYRTETPALDLIADETGAVVGVVTEGGRIKANKGVILACGGFENDPEMLECFLQSGSAKSSAAYLNTGDGIKMAQKLGAKLWHMSGWAGAWMAPRDLEDSYFLFEPLALARQKLKGHGITVAVNGRRFYMDFDGHNVKDADENAKFPGMEQHVGFRHGHTQFGGEWPNLPMPARGWYIFDANGLAAGALGEGYEGDPVADGMAYRADSIEELAEAIGVPADELVETVQVWNGFCADGKDVAFHRPVSTLAAIDTAPYYATLCCPTFLNTDGGPQRNADGQVLKIDGDPIDGLYTAGELGSFWGHYYQGAGNVGECLLSARFAVRHALAR